MGRMIERIIREEISRLVSESIDEEYYNAYHGSPCDTIVTGKFKKGKNGYMGPGIYFSESEEYATGYARKMGDGTLYTVEVRIENPLVLTSVNPTEEMLTKIYGTPTIYKKRSMKQGMDVCIIEGKDIKKLFSQGYDGVIWEYAGTREFVVYENNQIQILDKKKIEFRR